jgi:hypothetical protein
VVEHVLGMCSGSISPPKNIYISTLKIKKKKWEREAYIDADAWRCQNASFFFF